MNTSATITDCYSLLKDFRRDIPGDKFSFCIWIYLVKSSFPDTIMRLVHSGVPDGIPFVVVSEQKTLKLLCNFPVQEDCLNSVSCSRSPEKSDFSAHEEFPLRKWVHIACEISHDFFQLQMNGDAVESGSVTRSSRTSTSDALEGASLTGNGETDSIDGYVYNPTVTSSASEVQGHYIKHLPVQLCIDTSSALNVKEHTDGAWILLGSSMIFSVDVVLSNVSGQTVDGELEVACSLFYGNNSDDPDADGDALVLLNCDGMECSSSSENPSILLHGRATFRVKVLSLKCDARVFFIKFWCPKTPKYLFLQVLTPPIRPVSTDHSRAAALNKTVYSLVLPSLSPSSELDAISASKRVKLDDEKSSGTSEECEEECSSRVWTAEKVETYTRSDDRNHLMGSLDSEDTDEENSASKCISNRRTMISDALVFKYCLGSLREKTLILKGIVMPSYSYSYSSFESEKDLFILAREVSVYSGCSHHTKQIMMSKGLIEEGDRVWNSVSEKKQYVHREEMITEIEKAFLKMSRSGDDRSLSLKDLDVLRKITGCGRGVLISREGFDRVWNWVYPVAMTLSTDRVNPLLSGSPPWIKGLLTKEEAEHCLCNARKVPEPGTFVLRFPTSRSWPHPDSGSLIATYVGSDYALHHKLLSLDLFDAVDGPFAGRSLQQVLLSEPRLCRIARILRDN